VLAVRFNPVVVMFSMAEVHVRVLAVMFLPMLQTIAKQHLPTPKLPRITWLLPCVRTYCPLHRSQPIKDGLWTPLTTGLSPMQHALSTPTARLAPIPVQILSTFSDT